MSVLLDVAGKSLLVGGVEATARAPKRVGRVSVHVQLQVVAHGAHILAPSATVHGHAYVRDQVYVIFVYVKECAVTHAADTRFVRR